jgi:hypothetical protein
MGSFSLLPALYAYSRGFEEIRYVFVVFPIMIIFALILIEKIIERSKKRNFVTFLFILLIIISSIAYVDFRQIDYEREKQVLDIAEFVSGLDGKSNDYGSESYYVEVMDLEKEIFPILSKDIDFKSKIVLLQGKTIEEKIEDAKKQGLSYLVVTNNSSDDVFLEVYNNEKKYEYLEKILDSRENGFGFEVKIFKINFDRFET